jgi:hypothetical protein
MRRILFSLSVILGVALTAAHAGDKKEPFFNGKDLAGFEGLLDRFWSVNREGAIVGSTAPKGINFNTFLCSKKTYKNFEMQFEVRLTTSGNSGVQIRSKIVDKKNFAVAGPQCDMGGPYWGSLYGERFGGMMKAADAQLVKDVLKPGEFNDYYIKCVGKHVTIKLNGATTVDMEFKKMPDEGIIAFQIHGGPSMQVVFRNIRFKEIK